MSRTVARRRLAIKMQGRLGGARDLIHALTVRGVAARALPMFAVALFASAAPAAAQVPPDQDWRTITTERARVTFPANLEPLARRAAHRAEVALDELAGAFIEPPDGRIDIILTDHTDISNGFAQVTPSNRVTIFARPPADELGLGYFDDWLELVLTHEIAHVVHLDHTASGLGRLLRAVFGRVPGRWPFFPGFGAPRWLIEGLATWFESDLTAAGRLQGTFHEMQLRTAIIEDRFEGIDQASAPSPVWPAGSRAYAYGSLFFDHLMARHGEDSMADFAEAVAGQWIPYRMNAAGRSAFGVSLSDAWRAWGDSLEAEYGDLDAELRALGPITEPEHLTRGARWTAQPSVSADGTLAYMRSDGRSDAHLALREAGAGPATASDDTRRVRVNGIATFDWLPDGRLLVAQLEYQDPYRLHNDLYLVERDGSTRRLTHGARVGQPTAEPGGGTAVAVQEGEGTNALVRVDLSTGAVTPIVPPVPGEHWAYPSVSPNGRWIAATRWRTGGYHDVVVLDAATGRVRSEVTRDRALDHAPSWSPDGRWVVWASDRTGILNALGAEVDPETGVAGPPRLLTNVRTGATYPSVSPDGRLHFSVYHSDGWDIASIPFRPVEAPEAPPADPRFTAATAFEDGSIDAPVQGYSPFTSLVPRYWALSLRPPVRTPDYPGSSIFPRSRELLGFAVGAGTSGRDLVGRHAYDAFARVFTSGGKFEAGAAYAFLGLGNPVITLSGAQYYDEGGALLPRRSEDVPPDTLFVLERERAVFATTSFQSRRWRRTAQLNLSAGVVEEHDELLGNDLEPSTEYRLTRPTSRLGEVRASFRLSTARSFAMQLGRSKGLDLLLSARARRDWDVPDSLRSVARSDRSFEEAIGQVRGYLPLGGPGYAPHTLAARLVAGIADGPEAAGGHFEVGGTSGTPETLTGLALFGGSPEVFGVRGYREATRLGRYAWAASGEYRFPLALVHRGLGAWPLYFGRLSGALFADAGDAWDPGAGEGFVDPDRRVLASVGGELLAEVIALYDFGLLFRTGVAFPLVDGRGTTFYLGLGLPF